MRFDLVKPELNGIPRGWNKDVNFGKPSGGLPAHNLAPLKTPSEQTTTSTRNKY